MPRSIEHLASQRRLLWWTLSGRFRRVSGNREWRILQWPGTMVLLLVYFTNVLIVVITYGVRPTDEFIKDIKSKIVSTFPTNANLRQGIINNVRMFVKNATHELRHQSNPFLVPFVIKDCRHPLHAEIRHSAGEGLVYVLVHRLGSEEEGYVDMMFVIRCTLNRMGRTGEIIFSRMPCAGDPFLLYRFVYWHRYPALLSELPRYEKDSFARSLSL